jgi:hypothetical protein
MVKSGRVAWRRWLQKRRVFSCKSWKQTTHQTTVSLSIRSNYGLSDHLPDESFFAYVKTLSPAALDLELRSLVTLDQLRLFLGALVGRLSSRRDFEAVQTLQNVFLRMHGETIIANEELRSSLETLNQTQRNESEKVLELLASSLGTLGFVRDVM